mgnify:CR=1 FL=1
MGKPNPLLIATLVPRLFIFPLSFCGPLRNQAVFAVEFARLYGIINQSLKNTVDPKLLIAYFVIGGLIVSTVTYFGGQGKSELAAFIAFLPSISLITLCTIYFAGGTGAAVSYAKSMLILLPAWLFYVIGVIFLLPRLGLVGALLVSVAAYLAAAFATMRLT